MILSTKDRHQLQRHLKQATQLFKKREQGWATGCSISPTLQLERRLFASLSILSDYAESFLLGNWPEKPEECKVALLACFQSHSTEAFSYALAEWQRLLEDGSLDIAFQKLLYLATPTGLSVHQRDELLNLKVFDNLVSTLDGALWEPDTIRHIALHSSALLPAHVESSDSAAYSQHATAARAIIKDPGSASGLILKILQQREAASKWWQWLPLTGARDKAFEEHVMTHPEHLWACVFDSSSHMMSQVREWLNTSQLNESAAWVLEQWHAKPLEYKPVVSDAASGRGPANAPTNASLPETFESPSSPIFMGQPKTAQSVAQWLLQQSSERQLLGWLHLGQLTQNVLPDLSTHWLHTQLRQLDRVLQPGKIANAA